MSSWTGDHLQRASDKLILRNHPAIEAAELRAEVYQTQKDDMKMIQIGRFL